ncbi:MAG: hypothetical protein H0W76_24350 [Pyrinomonadaceae bacterium]|nr:hypothetical protein [Pyrinomonadaceae bacterium]
MVRPAVRNLVAWVGLLVPGRAERRRDARPARSCAFRLATPETPFAYAAAAFKACRRRERRFVA